MTFLQHLFLYLLTFSFAAPSAMAKVDVFSLEYGSLKREEARQEWNLAKLTTTFSSRGDVCDFSEVSSLVAFNTELTKGYLGYLPDDRCLWSDGTLSSMPDYSRCLAQRIEACYGASPPADTTFRIGHCSVTGISDPSAPSYRQRQYLSVSCPGMATPARAPWYQDALPELYLMLVRNAFPSEITQSTKKKASLASSTPQKKESPRQLASNDSDCCVCTTGTTPERHQHWYEKGCVLWFNYQNRNCSGLKKIIPIDQVEELQSSIPASCRRLELGYVGHWSNSEQTVLYTQDVLYPLAVNKQLSIKYDNTACSGADDADFVQAYLNKAVLPDGVELTINANQVDSVGMWLHFLPAKENVGARVGTGLSAPEYLRCEGLEGLPCWRDLVDNQTARCREESSGTTQIKTLSCQRVAVEPRARGGRAPVTRFRFEWTEADSASGALSAETANSSVSAKTHIERVINVCESLKAERSSDWGIAYFRVLDLLEVCNVLLPRYRALQQSGRD